MIHFINSLLIVYLVQQKNINVILINHNNIWKVRKKKNKRNTISFGRSFGTTDFN